MMNNTRAEELMAAYLSGNIGVAEQAELMAWVAAAPEGRRFFDNATMLWQMTEQLAYPDFSAGKRAAWDRLENRLANTGVHVQPAPQARLGIIRRLSIPRWAAAAAVLVLIVAGWWYTQSLDSQVVATTAAGERQQIALPDGTQVWLNEQSSLAYDDRSGERIITFTGEAFFEVATDSLRPFRVLAGDAVTTVLGTSFNLRAYSSEDQVEVSVKTGKVALERQTKAVKSTDAAQRVVLGKGQIGVLDEASVQLSTTETNQQNSTAWKDRRLDFDEVPLAQVIATLERYYDIEITLDKPEIGKCLFFGQYENDPKLDMVLLVMTESLGLEAQQSGNSYRLSGEGCD